MPRLLQLLPPLTLIWPARKIRRGPPYQHIHLRDAENQHCESALAPPKVVVSVYFLKSTGIGLREGTPSTAQRPARVEERGEKRRPPIRTFALPAPGETIRGPIG